MLSSYGDMIQQSKKMSAKARKQRVTNVLQRIIHTTMVQVFDLSRDHTAEKKQIREQDINGTTEVYESNPVINNK